MNLATYINNYIEENSVLNKKEVALKSKITYRTFIDKLTRNSFSGEELIRIGKVLGIDLNSINLTPGEMNYYICIHEENCLNSTRGKQYLSNIKIKEIYRLLKVSAIKINPAIEKTENLFNYYEKNETFFRMENNLNSMNKFVEDKEGLDKYFEELLLYFYIDEFKIKDDYININELYIYDENTAYNLHLFLTCIENILKEDNLNDFLNREVKINILALVSKRQVNTYICPECGEPLDLSEDEDCLYCFNPLCESFIGGAEVYSIELDYLKLY